MDWIIIFTYKQLVVGISLTLIVLFVGLYFFVRLWSKDRFEKLEERTASLEASSERAIYSNESETSSNEINHG